jgi:predicted Zn-dependent peptidase
MFSDSGLFQIDV